MDLTQTLLEAFKLVEEYDRQRPQLVKEFRLYYNEDGSIIGLWESSHPAGDNYIVINDSDVFYRHPTHLIKVVNKELKFLDPHSPERVRLKKSTAGYAVVKGNAALPLMPNENYPYIEHYDRTNN